jgi:transketolase
MAPLVKNKINSFLRKKSTELRLKILTTVFNSKTGHLGGSLSCVELLIYIFYSRNFKVGKLFFNKKERDRIVVSKGHCAVGFYSLLDDLGLLKKNEIKTFCKNNTRLGGHLSSKVPGVEVETGSLGHGLSVAAGIGWSAKLNKKNFKIIVIVSDGELYEGSFWEALIFISHHKLTNVSIIVDRNRQIVMNHTESFLKLEPLDKKFSSFGFNVKKINGHNFKAIHNAFNSLKKNKPNIIIADTIKAKGIKFMEGKLKWHHSIPNQKELNFAIKDFLNYHEK